MSASLRPYQRSFCFVAETSKERYNYSECKEKQTVGMTLQLKPYT